MKKTFSIFFLIIFLFNTAGYFILFKSIQFQVKKEIVAEIKSGRLKKELSVITINKSDLANIEWIEAGKEMRFQDKLYDVVKYSETSTTFTFFCIDDTEENILFANLNSHIKEHTLESKPDSKSKKVSDHITKLYFSNHSNTQFFIGVKTNYFPFKNRSFNSVFMKKNSPPPRFI